MIVQQKVAKYIVFLLFHFSSIFLQKPSFKFGLLKGCVHYIFASLFFKSKREHLSN